jgi:hypothetical protein
MQSDRIIKRKLCKDCKHFIADKEECVLFGDTDLVSGKNEYSYAKNARKNEDKCGENAKLFEYNKNKIITVPYYFLRYLSKYWPFFPVVLLLCIYIDGLYKLTHH